MWLWQMLRLWLWLCQAHTGSYCRVVAHLACLAPRGGGWHEVETSWDKLRQVETKIQFKHAKLTGTILFSSLDSAFQSITTNVVPYCLFREHKSRKYMDISCVNFWTLRQVDCQNIWWATQWRCCGTYHLIFTIFCEISDASVSLGYGETIIRRYFTYQSSYFWSEWIYSGLEITSLVI